jgi:hypothetical protein
MLKAKHQRDLFALFCNIFSYYKKEQIYSKDDNYFRFLHTLWMNWKYWVHYVKFHFKFFLLEELYLLQLDFIWDIESALISSIMSRENYAQESFPYIAAYLFIDCALKVEKWYCHLHHAVNFNILTTTSGAA